MFKVPCLAGLLLLVSLPSSASVLYQVVLSDSITGGNIIFARTLPSFLTLGQTLEFGFDDATETTGGAISSVPDTLILTQNASNIALETARVRFDPVIPPPNIFFPAISEIAFFFTAESPCALGQECSTAVAVQTGIFFTTGSPDGRGSSGKLTVSRLPGPPPGSEIPEPSTWLLGGVASGLVVFRSRRP